jgi:glutamate dehydrogenase
MKKMEIKDEKDQSLRDFKGKKKEEVRSLIQERHPGPNGQSLLAFLSVVFESFSDFHFIRGVDADDLYHMIFNYHEFFMQDLRPMDERFEDMPPTAIRILNPSQETEYKEVVKHLEFETTVIQLHTKDGPFIFESIWNFLKKKGFHVFNAIHPVISVRRENGKIAEIHEGHEKGEREVLLNIYIEKIVNPKNRKALEFEVLSVLKALFFSIVDFRKMLGTVEELAETRRTAKLPADTVAKKDLGEQADFLKWLAAENFIFMGIQKYAVQKTGKKTGLVRSDIPGLGVFRDPDLMEVTFPGQLGELEERIDNSLNHGPSTTFEYYNTGSSAIYHFDPLDIILVDDFNKKGETVSRTVVLGRYSRGSKFQKSSLVPILSGKIASLLQAAEKKFSTHYKRETLTIFNQFPKRELLYLELSELRGLIQLILSVESDEKVEAFVKIDPREYYFSLFVILSRGKYSREIRERIKRFLLDTYKHPITRWETIDCLPNTVLVFYFDTRKGKKISLDVDALEVEIQDIISTWDDHLVRALVHEHGDRAGFAFYNKYRQAFSGLYKELTHIRDAVYDVRYLDGLEKNREVRINIFPGGAGEVIIKLYSFTEIDLMTIIPTARNLGLYVTSEQVLPLRLHSGETAYIHIFEVSGDEAFLEKIIERQALLSEVLLKIMEGKTGNDRLSCLVLQAGFNWKAIELFRAIKNYLLQIDNTFSPNSIDDVLLKFVDITINLFSYFDTKFKPGKKNGDSKGREKSLAASELKFLDSLTQVASLIEDQIFRGLFDVAKNMLRTNFYKSPDINYVSFKVDCRSVAKMPSPRPLYEIYVHSPELEGVHLRGGKVARGGLRWSDRYDDFRTEILGLMKTQMVKNSVIVPVGSKGGFVLQRKDFKNPKETEVYVKEQYQTFICGLLDITDNIVAGEMVRPPKVVAYDEFDPYLVVAADKGTAKLSDAANEVSGRYGFWLGDAFASGGAVGYDHKKEAITARGAWECVKRHFREREINIQEESIRVAGIGDMAGDVFGNGMLLSKKIKLVAAFNHAHIFIDPDPDQEKSWVERKRLFDNPRLSWMDYDRDLISAGGGVFPRSSKSITLSPEAKKMIGTSKDLMNGEELIRSILTSDVDLLWNGGIGAYIKASTESHLDVGDRANDRVRVDAKNLHAKVLGEGGNLGCTQLARMEAGAKGVACNTDAVDNSGGVDMSDHEVNLKILLDALLEKGEIKSGEERNELFARVTDEVARLVLKDNYLQSAALSMDRIRSAKKIEPFLDALDRLSDLKILSREEEFVPDRDRLLEGKEKNKGITRPVLAIPLGYSKIYAYQEILRSPLMDTIFVERYLDGYFPEIFHREFPAYLRSHRLKKEIISTVVTNKIINQAGITFFFQMEEKTGKKIWEIARAYLIIENMLDSDAFRARVYSLDNAVPSDIQYRMLMDLEHVIFLITEWMLSNMPEDRISFDLINLYQGVIANFKKNLVQHLETVCSMDKGCLDRDVEELTRKKVPLDLAEACSALPYLKDTMAILRIKEELHYNFIDTGNLYIRLNHYLFLDWIEECLEEIVTVDKWEEEAGENLYEELKDYQNRIVVNILNFKRKEETIDDSFNNYMRAKEKADKAFKSRVAWIRENGKMNLINLSVLVRTLKNFL